MKGVILILAGLVVLLGSVGRGNAGQITTVTTVPNGYGSGLTYLGDPALTTIGQTITATASNNVLTSFTFYLNSPTGPPLTFQAYVSAWDGSKLTGALLFTSGNITVPTPSGYTAYTFDTGGVNLVVGQQYALFISVTGANYAALNSGDAHANLAGASTTYSGGSYIANENSGNFGQLYSAAGWIVQPEYDTTFIANFSDGTTTAPEPATLSLLGIGIAGMAGYGWQRRKLATTA